MYWRRALIRDGHVAGAVSWNVHGVTKNEVMFVWPEAADTPIVCLYLRHFGQIWRMISALNSAKFSRLDTVDKIDFQDSFFSGLGLTSGWLRPQKDTLSIGTIGVQQNFVLSAVRRIPGRLQFLALTPLTLEASISLLPGSICIPANRLNHSSHISIIHTITSLLITDPFVIVIAIDFSKAFDTVRYSSLLLHYGPCRHYELYRYSRWHSVPQNSYQPKSRLSAFTPRKS